MIPSRELGFALLSFFAALLFVSCGSQSDALMPDLRELLPQDRTTAYQMNVHYPEPFQELWGRFTAAMQQNPEWWQEYIYQNGNVSPLPYHQNMGLTEDEYATLVTLMKSESLVPAQHLSLNITEPEPNTIRLAIDQIPQLANGITFSLTDSTVTTHLGTFANPEVLNVTDAEKGGVFGQYTGYRWAREDGALLSGQGMVYDLILLRRKFDQKRFLHYRGTKLEASAVTERFELIVGLDEG